MRTNSTLPLLIASTDIEISCQAVDQSWVSLAAVPTIHFRSDGSLFQASLLTDEERALKRRVDGRRFDDIFGNFIEAHGVIHGRVLNSAASMTPRSSAR